LQRDRERSALAMTGGPGFRVREAEEKDREHGAEKGGPAAR
jgi:hypothetical protein